MTNFLDWLLGRREPSSAKTAMERLQFVLVTDRSQLSPENLRAMQEEIIEVIQKYCRIDKDAVEMKLELRERENFLVADIPLRRSADQAEDEDPGHISFSLQTTSGNESAEPDDTDAI